jgi:hypothetical protein
LETRKIALFYLYFRKAPIFWGSSNCFDMNNTVCLPEKPSMVNGKNIHSIAKTIIVIFRTTNFFHCVAAQLCWCDLYIHAHEPVHFYTIGNASETLTDRQTILFSDRNSVPIKILGNSDGIATKPPITNQSAQC